MVNPRQAWDVAKATGRLAKIDALDAHGLAHFAEAVVDAQEKNYHGHVQMKHSDGQIAQTGLTHRFRS